MAMASGARYSRLSGRRPSACLLFTLAVSLGLILIVLYHPRAQRAKLPLGLGVSWSALSDRKAPEWCSTLMAHPRPSGYFGGPCKARGRFDVLCSDKKPGFFSQYSQDQLLFTQHFKYLNRTGTYVDLAANEPISISNTYFFDRCLGWRGLCVEPNPNYHEALKAKRSCTLETTCVSDRVHNVSFILAGGWGGISATNKNEAYANRRRINLTCKTTAKALADADITHIDYLSLDVEGHEEYVLRGIDWSTTTINIISIELETNTAAAAKILANQGFRRFDISPLAKVVPGLRPDRDVIFLHNRVIWGKPV